MQFLIIALIFIIDLIWLALTPASYIFDTKKILFIFLVSIFLFIYKKFRPEPRIITLCEFTILFLNFSFYAMILSYLTYTLKLPTVDKTLAAVDETLGFHSLPL
jgi:hypothetical protein